MWKYFFQTILIPQIPIIMWKYIPLAKQWYNYRIVEIEVWVYWKYSGHTYTKHITKDKKKKWILIHYIIADEWWQIKCFISKVGFLVTKNPPNDNDGYMDFLLDYLRTPTWPNSIFEVPLKCSNVVV